MMPEDGTLLGASAIVSAMSSTSTTKGIVVVGISQLLIALLAVQLPR